ncbi:uncharacterized protein LOC118404993 [Branchiostoma floridae]|nr:uncharacterized protein LOC118404993 [Branchiostoma floridae]
MWQWGRDKASSMWQWRPWSADKPKPQLPEVSGSDYSSVEYPFENLVLKGGGAKGIAYIGACKVLDEAGILPNIKRFAGTSAGAITATLLAIGMSPQEMLEVLSEKNLIDLLDPPSAWLEPTKWLYHIPGVPDWLTVDLLPKAIAAWTKRGMHRGNDFYDWFGVILEEHLKRLYPDEKRMDRDITFDRLYRATGKELCIVAYNMILGCETYFHVKTTPMVKIRDAVRMSMSIPVAFQPFEGYGFPKFTFIDGGLAANYPIWAFDGWYLSMDEADTFKQRLASVQQRNEENKEKIRRMFEPQYRRKERFNTRNDKTLGIVLFSRKDPELYQERFKSRLRKLEEKEHPTPKTELYEEYKKEMTKQEEVRKTTEQLLNELVGDQIKGLKKCIEDGDEEGAWKHFDKIFSRKHLDILNVKTQEEAIEMLLMDDDRKLTTEMLKKIDENVGPLQLVKGRLRHRHVSKPSDYYSTMLEFVGHNSGIEEEDVDRSMAIDVDYVGTMDFDMAPKDMEFLMRQGAVATVAFLEERKREKKDEEK